MAKIKTNTAGNLPANVNDFLKSFSDSWEVEGSILKKGSRSTVKSIQVGSHELVIKIYKKMPLHRRFRYALTRSRARQSWESAQVMLAAGIPVAQPLALLEEHQLGIPSRAALLMETASGEDLLGLVERNELTPDQIATIAQSLQSIFCTMRVAKITHGDLKATNIIIDRDLQPVFIDIDAAQQHRSTASYRKLQVKDECRFLANWQSTPEVAKAFAQVFE